MKINRIENIINLDEQFETELQGCLNDCKSYSGKTQAINQMIISAGFNGKNPSVNEAKKIIAAFGFCCCYSLGPKTSILL